MDTNMFSNDFKKYLKWICIPFIIILLLPILLTKLPFCIFDFSNTGEVGDTIGGIMGPFVAIAAAILTFLAFWVQFKANEQQRKDIAKERFESKLYELLHLHRENLHELESDGKKGRQVIAQFCNYISILYSLIYGFFPKYYASDINVLNIYKKVVEKYNDERYLFIDISYNIFFYGTKVTNRLKDEELYLYNKILEMIHKVCVFKDMNEQGILKLCNDINDAPEKYFSRDLKWDTMYANGKLNYPSDLLKGRNGTLGLYFRQLYHIVKMVATSQVLVDEKEKYEYVKILRTQLSDYEQVLLYYNSLTNMGKKWNETNQTQSSSKNEYSWTESMAFIPRFRLIKNIPPSYKFIGITPEEVYKAEIGLYDKHNIKFFELR